MARPEARKQTSLSIGGENLTFPMDLGHRSDAAQHYILITSRSVNRDVPGVTSSGIAAPLSIALYLPAGALKHDYSQRYETFEGYEMIQSSSALAIAKAVKEGSVQGADYDKSLMDFVKGAAGDERVVRDVAADTAASATTEAIRRSDIAQAGLIGAGLGINPHLTQMYKGPGEFRTFNLSYDFIARNNQESELISKIVHRLRERMLPSKFNTQIHSYFLQVPHHFKLEVYVNNQKNDPRRLYKIIDTVLTNMTVDFAGSGVPVFFKDTGEPFNVKLDLTFQETRVLTKQVFEDGENIYVDGNLTTNFDLERQGIESRTNSASATSVELFD